MITEKPRRNDKAVLDATAKVLAPQVAVWLADGTSGTSARLISGITKAIRNESDGYAIAKALACYNPDAELVEILNDARYIKGDELRKALALWVAENNLMGPAVGATVQDMRHPEDGIGVVLTNEIYGESVVFFADLGHVQAGLGTHGSYVAWERLIETPDFDSKVPADPVRVPTVTADNAVIVAKPDKSALLKQWETPRFGVFDPDGLFREFPGSEDGAPVSDWTQDPLAHAAAWIGGYRHAQIIRAALLELGCECLPSGD